jgi:hypothetical protein
MTGPAKTGSAWSAQLVRAYPAKWRGRYGDELAQLIEDLQEAGRKPIPMAADLLGGALAAWLHERRPDMSERAREGLIAVLWNWVAFAAVAAWFGHDLGVYPPALAQQPLVLAHSAVPDAYHVLIAAGVVGVLATALAAVVFALDAGRQALRTHRRSTFVLMALPVLIGAAWLGGLQLLPPDNHTAGKLLLAVGWLLLGVAGIAAATQAVVSVIKRSEFSDRTWRAGGAAAAAVVAAMAVATGATITWGVAFHASLGQSGDLSGWLTVTAIMAVTTVRAVIALLGTRRAHAEATAATA